MPIKSFLKQIIPSKLWKELQETKGFVKLLHYSLVQNKRYLAHCSAPWNEIDEERLRSRLVYFVHRIEKGLSHTEFRQGFGEKALKDLDNTMRLWNKCGYPQSDLTYQAAMSVVIAYAERHAELGLDYPDFLFRLFPEMEVNDSQQKLNHSSLSGVQTVKSTDQESQDNNFSGFFKNRVSIREFSETPVDMGKVKDAISLSMKTPSVCNRQSFRVTIIQNPGVIERSLNIQGGWRGYTVPPMLLAVTSDIRCFINPEERNEPYIDGGLFGMSLLLALKSMSLATCPLNTMFHSKQEKDIREVLKVPESDVFIMLIAVGNFPEKVLAPKSFRNSADVITRVIE